MWAQQYYALQSPASVHPQSDEHVHFGTTRALQSVASQFYLWDHQIAHPECTLHDPSSCKVYLAEGISPMDALGYGLMAAGMVKQMGDTSKPPIALTLKQTLWIMDFLDACWASASTLGACHEIVVAAVTHLLGWLAWLQSVELFSLLCWADVTITCPDSGPTIGLPTGISALELCLLPETK